MGDSAVPGNQPAWARKHTGHLMSSISAKPRWLCSIGILPHPVAAHFFAFPSFWPPDYLFIYNYFFVTISVRPGYLHQSKMITNDVLNICSVTLLRQVCSRETVNKPRCKFKVNKINIQNKTVWTLWSAKHSPLMLRSLESTVSQRVLNRLIEVITSDVPGNPAIAVAK